jgi:hypothetical protein
MLRRPRLVAAAPIVLGALLVAPLCTPAPAVAAACDLHYVAMGDDVPAGNDSSSEQAYPHLLLTKHLEPSPGTWCKYGTPKNGVKSSEIISGGQMATGWNMEPNLITLSVGEQNSPIENLVDSCFSDVESHDFVGAASCAGEVLGDIPAFESLRKDLTSILNDYKMMMMARPDLVVAVVGYPNPYPSLESAEENVLQLCNPLVDTIVTCLVRWEQFPPALEVINQAFKKLNGTIAEAVLPFAEGYRGRFMFIDPTSAFSSHCMKMEVAIQTQVSHGDEIVEEDSEKGFGCETSWWSTHGSGNFDPPTYLEPAASGVLVGEEQETTGMGVFPNQEGQQCIADLIWEAVKIKLAVPQAPEQEVCEQSNSTTSNPTLNPTGPGTGEASAGGAAGAAVRAPLTVPARAAAVTKRHRVRVKTSACAKPRLRRGHSGRRLRSACRGAHGRSGRAHRYQR